ncbi:MAG: penicillin acylase family protein, partial [Rhodothermales bacterium]
MERISNSFFSPSGSRKQNLQSVSVSGSYMVAVLALLMLTFAIAAGFFWYLSYGFEDTPAKSVTIQNISAPADIAWYPNGLASIKSNDLNASLAALGYAHAVKNPWQMMLWRQTALGNLSAWFGPSLLKLDRFNKQLRLAKISQATYESLSENEQEWLIAYTAGVNNAISEQHLLSHNDFAFLGSEIAQWEPWHTLALERMFAWLATNFSSISDPAGPERDNILNEVIESDEFLHRFLQVHDFQYSFTGTWHSTDAQETDFFFQRFVYGASAHTIVQEVNFQLQSQQEVLVSTIPGTFIFLSGHSRDMNWAILPTSTLSLGQHHITQIPKVSHERITNRDGTEILATVNHFPGLLNLESTLDIETDSSYALYWNGFTEGTDSFAF